MNRPTPTMAVLVMALTSIVAVRASIRAEGIAPRGAQRSVWDSVFTQTQAARGDSLYRAACGSCHGPTLGGHEDSPPLVGSAFLANWYGLTIGDLYDRIRNSMPPEKPKSLDKQLITDVIAHMLNQNHFPSGATELTADPDTMRAIKIESSKP